ncbi:MAG: hypothetical protein JJE21_09535 [Spirochaetaceae bacterium]|nr:hypothetical protein [Spirochaetaceae bacterium]
MDEDTEIFISDLEKKFGGKLTWRTFSTWYGCSDGIQREFGVFMFQIEDTFHFEDFKKENLIFGIKMGTSSNKKREPFVKLEREFNKNQIKSINTTTRSIANNIINKKLNSSAITNINLIDKLFKKLVTAVTLKDGTIHFFELIGPKEFEVAAK